jgi:glycosyltransferase involved in cell wall biosynthesis
MGHGVNEMTGKRILMLLENNPFPKDGRVRHEALALTAAGYQVAVICQRAGQQPWYEQYQGVHVYRYPAPPSGHGLIGYMAEYGYSLIAAFVLSLIVWLHRGFDVIHTHNPPDFFVIITRFYQCFGKRYIYDHHDLAPDMYQALYGDQAKAILYRILRFFEYWSLRRADHIIATNESYKQLEIERAQVPADRITVVRNGPNVNGFKTIAPNQALRAKGKTIIGYVGEMGYHDGIDYLLRALHHLIHDLGRTDFYCVLIGAGSAWESLQALTQTLKINEYVCFTGWLSNQEEEFWRYLASTDICVDPGPKNSYTDRSSTIKMTEYMAMGKPIVAFDLTEHRASAQAACLYARPNDELDFARKLVELMDDPARRTAMGAYGQQRVEAELTWRHSVPHLLRAYEKTLGPALYSRHRPREQQVSG